VSEEDTRFFSAPASKQAGRLWVALIGSCLLALVAMGVNVASWLRMDASLDRVEIGTMRMAEWAELLAIYRKINHARGAYAENGDPEKLLLMEESLQQLAYQWEVVDDLSELSLVNPHDVSQRVVELRRKGDQWVSLIEQALTLREYESEGAGRTLLASSHTRDRYLELSDALNEQIQISRQNMNEWLAETRGDLRTALISIFCSGLLAIALAGLAALLLHRMLRAIHQAEKYSQEKQQAQAAKQQRDSFLAMMSHEIRTPLNAILGFGELVQLEAKGERVKRYANSIVEGGQSLLQLINDVLDLSKLEAGMLEYKPSPTSLPRMMQFIERLFHETCTAKGLRFETYVQEDLPDSLLLDPVRLRQVLMNLAGNAVKFTEQGYVRVEARGTPKKEDASIWDIHLTVEDSGPGVVEEERSKIFDAFVQSERQKTNTTKGTGLGLAIVKRFIDTMEGRITVEPAKGGGARFDVQLPETGVSARLSPMEHEQGPAVDFNDLKPSAILVADDNPINRELLLEMFENTHHRVFCASDGQEAITQALRLHPDMVLMDLRMPGMDGVTALNKMRQRAEFRMLPVLAVTASTSPNEDASLAEIFDGYVRKPFTRSELYQEMAQFLSRADKEEAVAAPAPPIKSESTIEDQELVQWLHTLLREEWPVLRSGMSLSDIEQFGQRLAISAERSRNEPLGDYAGRIQQAADSFTFSELEVLLQDFPRVVESVTEGHACERQDDDDKTPAPSQ